MFILSVFYTMRSFVLKINIFTIEHQPPQSKVGGLICELQIYILQSTTSISLQAVFQKSAFMS